MLIKIVSKEGQMIQILCKPDWRFKVVNALFASTSKTALFLSAVKMVCIAWTAASHPSSWLAQSWGDPAASNMSGFNVFSKAFAIIRWWFSHMPMGRTTGHLSNWSRQATNASIPTGSTFSVHNILAAEARASQSSLEALRKETIFSTHQHRLQMVHQLF